MIYPEGLMHKKVNILLALVILIAIAAVFAWLISVRASGNMLGVNILTPPLKCILEPDTETCPNCIMCGDNPACAGVFEVQAQFLSGVNGLYKGTAFCIANSIPPNGGSFKPGGQCLGIIATPYPAVHTLINFGCTP